MIEITNLQKIVDQHTVLDIENLTVGVGEVVAVVGPSDSGTKSLFSLCLGRTQPTAGSVRIAGISPATERLLFSQAVGVLFDHDTLYQNRTPHANLEFQARLRGLPQTRVSEVLTQVGLADHARAKLDQLSSGLRRRLAFGIAILHRPQVLLLAEPFARCDEGTINLLGHLIGRHREEEGSVLILAETDSYLSPLCDVIYTLELGRIASQRRPDEQSNAALPFKIPVKLEGRIALINPSDILYVVSEEGRVFLQTTGERLPTQFTLQELEDRLSRSGFYRAHRGYLVNLQHVTEVIPFTRSSYSLRLNDESGTLIPLSKDAARDLRQLLDY